MSTPVFQEDMGSTDHAADVEAQGVADTCPAPDGVDPPARLWSPPALIQAPVPVASIIVALVVLVLSSVLLGSTTTAPVQPWRSPP